MADEIKYSDIISPEVQKQLDELTATVRELTKELEQLSKATQSEEKASTGYNETLLDTVDITEDLIRLTQEEKELKDNLTKTQKKYEQALADGNTEADAYAIAVKKGKEELSKHGFVLKNATKLAIAQKTSMTELSLELGKNRMRYRNLTKAERDNIKIGGRLLKTIKTQDAAIKKMDKTIGNTQRNVGNYTKAMGRATVSTKKWGRAVTGAIIGGLVASTKNMQAAADVMADVTNSAVITVGNIAKVAKGQMSITEALNVADIYAAAKAMTDVMRQMEYLNALEDKRYSRVRLDIEQQKVIREDVALNYRDRFAAIGKLNDLLDESDRILKASHEDRLKEFEEIHKNDPDNIAAMTGKVRLETELSNRLRENEVQRREALRGEIKLQKIYKDEVDSMGATITDLWIIEHDINNKSYNEQIDFYDKLYTARSESYQDQLKTVEEFSSEYKQILNNMYQHEADHIEHINELNRLKSQKQLDDVAFVASSAAQLMSIFAEENKELQVATAIVNTFAGVAAALGSGPPPYNFITAALVLAAGMATVAKMENVAMPSFAVGTESVEGDQVAQVHDNERILPAYLNKQINGIDNVDLPRLVNIGLNAPKIFDGIEDMIAQQQSTNNLLSRFAYVEKSGTVIYLSGDKKYYV